MSVGVKIVIFLIIIIAIGYVLINKDAIFNFNNNTPQNTVTNSAPDERSVKEVFEMNLEAAKNCDIELSNSLITEESKKIIHSTCSNMANERKCHINKEMAVLTKENTAVLYFPPFNHDEGWPFFFAKEDGEWRIDYYKMSNGITMLGGGCDTGWGWRSEDTQKEFCSYFSEGKCPDKLY